jgi:PTH1 family peptidyl-tRNA hydrolase
MLGAVGAEAERLARHEDTRFMNDVALRQQELSPARTKKPSPCKG